MGLATDVVKDRFTDTDIFDGYALDRITLLLLRADHFKRVAGYFNQED